MIWWPGILWILLLNHQEWSLQTVSWWWQPRCESQLFGVSKASYVSWDTVMITRSLSIYLSIYLFIYLSIYIYIYIYVYISICRAEPCIAGCLGIIDWEHCNLSFGHMGYPCQMSRLLRNLWKKSTEPWKCGWNEGLSIEQGDFLGSTTRAIASEIHWNPGIVSFMSCSVIYQLSWTPNVHTYINTYVRTYVCVCIYMYT